MIAPLTAFAPRGSRWVAAYFVVSPGTKGRVLSLVHHVGVGDLGWIVDAPVVPSGHCLVPLTIDPAELYARLVAAPRGATGSHGAAQAHIARALAAVLTTLAQQIKALTVQISQELAAHVDQHIFTTLPRSGTVRAARLLAEIGDCRGRFPTPESLACLAGVAPSTRQSGKSRVVGFRWACDKQLRDAVCDFAGDSRQSNPWAADLYQRARARGHDHPHAVRILARLAVCHLALLAKPRRLRPQPAPSSATPTQSRSSSRSLTQGISLLLGTAARDPCLLAPLTAFAPFLVAVEISAASTST